MHKNRVSIPSADPFIYEGEPFTQKPEGKWGFIYRTTLPDGREYVGKRGFYKGWKSYFGSGRLLTAYINKHGHEGIVREILVFCDTKKKTADVEEALLKALDVKNNPKYINLSDSGSKNGKSTKEPTQRQRDSARELMASMPRAKKVLGAINSTKKNWSNPEYVAKMKQVAKEVNKDRRKPVTIQWVYGAQVFESIHDCAEKTGFRRSSIRLWNKKGVGKKARKWFPHLLAAKIGRD